ncbi:pentatricopeptide repeat-containing protein, putative [Ricinus communis]|uniref:Pentatricopeptide repeat-containing protein, putative n=1 Tax=Ricinus communis TaxID=3988 RepID=B9RWW5_RICCO|nr:pentatricopeptide repeat-containing protein, putative [Ricinus communis]
MISSTSVTTIKLSRYFSSFSSASSSIQNLLKRGFTPTLKSINQYLLFLVKIHKFTLVPHFLSQLNQNQIEGNYQTHSLFLLALLKLKNFEEAEHFIKTHRAKSSSSSKGHKFLDSLIQAISTDEKDPNKALLVLHDCLRNYGMLPSSFTFCSVIHSFVLQGNMSGAIQVLELMNDEKINYPFCNFVCSSIVSGFCKMGKPELAMGFFENSLKLGALKPNLVTYTAVVSSLCMLGRADEVFDLVCEMEEEGLAFDVVFYSCWICGYFRNGVFIEAIRKHKEMVKKGISSDTIGYTILIDGFSKEGSVEKSVGFLHHMLANGSEPNLVTYTAIILGFCRKGKIDEAFAIFKLVENLGIKLDEFIYAILVDGFCLKGDFDRAYQLIEEMEKKGITPTIVAYNILINSLCKAGRTFDADEVSKALQGDKITYSALLHGYIKEENSIGILEVRQRLEEARIQMDIIMFNIILKALFVVGAFEDVLVLYNGMQEMNLVANSITYCTIIGGFCKVGRIDEALEIFDEFRHGLGSSVACYNCMINGLCKNGMVDMAAEIFVELIEKGLTLDIGICMTLIKAIVKEKSADGVLDLIYRIQNIGSDKYDSTVWNYAMSLLSKRKFSMAASEVYMVARRNKLVLTSKSYYLIIKGLIGDGKFWLTRPILSSFMKEYGLIEPKDVKSALYFFNKMKEDNAFVTFPEGYLLDAKQLFESMVLKGFKWNIRIYNSFINGYCKFGQFEEALKILKIIETECLDLDEFSGDMEGALRFFLEYKQKGISPDFLGFLYLIRGLCGKGRMEEARNILREMLQSQSVMELLNKVNTEVETESIESFLLFLCEKGSIKEAVAVLNEIGSLFFPVQKWSSPSESQSLQSANLSLASCDATEVDEVVETSDDLGESKFNCFASYYSVIASLCSKGELGEANRFAKEKLASWEGIS